MTYQSKNKIKQTIVCFVLAFLFFGGVLLGGSDGAWFPWANLIGATMLGTFGLIANRLPPPL